MNLRRFHPIGLQNGGRFSGVIIEWPIRRAIGINHDPRSFKISEFTGSENVVGGSSSALLGSLSNPDKSDQDFSEWVRATRLDAIGKA
jgi:hypothetical protein